jgi:hypothetical protein
MGFLLVENRTAVYPIFGARTLDTGDARTVGFDFDNMEIVLRDREPVFEYSGCVRPPGVVTNDHIDACSGAMYEHVGCGRRPALEAARA